MTTLAEKKRQLVAKLSLLDDWQDRMSHVVDLGRKFPALEDACRTPEHRVEGCISNLWFVPEFRDGVCRYRCDSDAAIVKGIASLLCDFYSGQPPAEILRHEPSFLAEVGITQHLSPNRRNGLGRLWARIRDFAAAHAAA
jgi:cysteine desulfuration protein SufE